MTNYSIPKSIRSKPEVQDVPYPSFANEASSERPRYKGGLDELVASLKAQMEKMNDSPIMTTPVETDVQPCGFVSQLAMWQGAVPDYTADPLAGDCISGYHGGLGESWSGQTPSQPKMEDCWESILTDAGQMMHNGYSYPMRMPPGLPPPGTTQVETASLAVVAGEQEPYTNYSAAFPVQDWFDMDVRAMDTAAATQQTRAQQDPVSLPKKRGRARRGKRFWSRFVFHVSTERVLEYELAPKLIGVNGCNMKSIRNACGGAKLRLRGRGSKFGEVPQPDGTMDEINTSLQLCLSCSNQMDLDKASEMVRSLLDMHAQNFAGYCKAYGLECPEVFYTEEPGCMEL